MTPTTAPLPSRRLQALAQAVLLLGCVGLDPGWLLGAFSLALVLMAALKLLEARDRAGRRLVALLQLVGCGLLAAQQPELLPSLLQLLAVLLSLAGLLQLEGGLGPSWALMLRRSLRLLTAALPMALVLFLLLPRVGPFGTGMGGPAARARTGLSDSLDPGSIATLVDDNSPAARVAFSDDRPPATDQRYWRVLVHPRFDGQRWQRHPDAEAAGGRPGTPQPAPQPAAQTGGRAQVWLTEPSRFTAVPWDGSGQPRDGSLQPRASGELQLRRPAAERRSYRLLEQPTPLAWQQQPPGPADLALPAGANPRLRALGQRWATLADPAARVAAAQAWFEAGDFRYDLRPGSLPARDGLDAFLFERRVGFCGHYASAFSALMRAAGVPSRVVSGYLGGTWVEPVGGAPYLDLRQSEAHAWSEVWLPGRGWQRVDASGWARNADGGRGDSSAGRGASSAGPHHWLWLQRQWWGLDMAWSRWWLGFDRDRQEALLAWLLGNRRGLLGWGILLGLALTLAAGVGLMGRRHRRRDPWQRDRRALLALLRGLGLEAAPGESLEQLAARGGARHPELAAPLAALVADYSALRFAAPRPGAEARRQRRRWQASLRRLKQQRRDAIRHPSGSGP